MSDVTDQLNSVVTDVTNVINELNVPATESLGDQVLAAILPVLEAAGYTAPATDSSSTTASDTSSSDTSATPSE